MEKAILDKLIEIDKKMDKNFERIDKRFEAIDERFERIDKKMDEQSTEIKEIKNEIIEFRAETKQKFLGVGDVFDSFGKFMTDKFKETDKEVKGLKNEIKNEFKNINDKVDIFYASDILNKEILNDHENRITEIAKRVGIEKVKKEEEIRRKKSV